MSLNRPASSRGTSLAEVRGTVEDSEPALQNVELSRLRPDWLNPRFSPGAERAFTSDEDVYAYIDLKFDAASIAESMSRHGFFPTEPLIVIPEEADSQAAAVGVPKKNGASTQYIVLEGNRRLTALQGLSNETIRGRMHDARWSQFVLSKPLPLTIPVLVAQSREQVAPILGYRHVTGIAPWDPYQQARYVASLIDAEDGLSATEVAQLIGRELSEVRAFYRNYSIVEQARDVFEIEDIDRVVDEFGVWTRAMTSVGIRDYIDAPSPRDVQERMYPLAEESKDALNRVVTWIFGEARNTAESGVSARTTRSGRLITDSRQLTRFGKALTNPQGRAVIEEGGTLAEAERAGLDKYVRFSSAIDDAIASVGIATTAASPAYLERDADKISELVDLVEGLRVTT